MLLEHCSNHTQNFAAVKWAAVEIEMMHKNVQCFPNVREQDDFVHGDSTTDEAQSHDCCKRDTKHKENSQYVFLGAW